MSSTPTKDYKNSKTAQQEGPGGQAGFPESFEPLDSGKTDTADKAKKQVQPKKASARSERKAGIASNGAAGKSTAEPLEGDKSERPTD